MRTATLAQPAAMSGAPLDSLALLRRIADPHARHTFLDTIAALLSGEVPVGDGEVYRWLFDVWPQESPIGLLLLTHAGEAKHLLRWCRSYLALDEAGREAVLLALFEARPDAPRETAA